MITLNSLVEAKLFGSEVIPGPTRWTGSISSEAGKFRVWIEQPGAQLAEIEADMVASNCGNADGNWARLAPGVAIAAVVFNSVKDSQGEIYRPVKTFLRPAPELQACLNYDRFPLVGRLSGALTFRRAKREFILGYGSNNSLEA